MRFKDIDGDGKLDIVVPLIGGDLVLLTNQSSLSNLSFLSSSFGTEGAQVLGFAISDMDADHLPDLALSFVDQTIGVYRQLLTGGFELARERHFIDAAEIGLDTVNSDDQAGDIVLPDNEFGTVSALYLSDMSTSIHLDPYGIETTNRFEQRTSYGQLLLADFDNNSLTDIIAVDLGRSELSVNLHIPWPYKPEEIWDDQTQTWIPAPQDVVYAHETTRYGTSYLSQFVGGDPTRVAAGDLDGDGIRDVAVLTEYVDGDAQWASRASGAVASDKRRIPYAFRPDLQF